MLTPFAFQLYSVYPLISASDGIKDICNDLNLTQLITEPARPNFILFI